MSDVLTGDAHVRLLYLRLARVVLALIAGLLVAFIAMYGQSSPPPAHDVDQLKAPMPHTEG